MKLIAFQDMQGLMHWINPDQVCRVSQLPELEPPPGFREPNRCVVYCPGDQYGIGLLDEAQDVIKLLRINS